MKKAELFIRLPADAPERAAVAEVFANGKRLRSGSPGGLWSIEASSPTSIPVPEAGNYNIRLRFPGGETFDAAGDVAAGTRAEISVPAGPRSGARLSSQRGSQHRREPGPVEFAVGLDSQHPFGGPRVARPRVSVRGPDPSTVLEVTSHPEGWLMKFSAPAGWWRGERFFLVVRPEAGPTYVQSVPAMADLARSEPVEVLYALSRDASSDPISVLTGAKDPLAAFLASGDFSGAGALAVGAETAFRDKVEDPYRAALGSYLLVQTRCIDRLHGWSANLASNFALPDGPILAAWELLLHPSGDDRMLADAWDHLQTALSRGPPLFTGGIRLVREGLLRLERQFSGRPAWARSLERTRLWSRHVRPRSLFTLFELPGGEGELEGLLGAP